jgi:tRNA pseudouridine38-40 synthase
MRNIRLTLSYDGSDFFGWQLQPDRRTVQGVVEEALGVILEGSIRIYGSGRTDAGVHALGQVANFRTESKIELLGLKRGLNSLLPKDIRVLDLCEVAEEFDSRRLATSRIYRYIIIRCEVVLPFARNYAWHITDDLDVEEMRRAGSEFIGTHDFSSFAGSEEIKGGDEEGRNSKSKIREVFDFSIRDGSISQGIVIGEFVEITIEANAFLRHMVRNIVGTVVDVGRGKMGAKEIIDILEAKDRSAAGATAPPNGLYLVEVKYT